MSELKNQIRAPIKKSNKIKILDFYQIQISKLENEGRIGYSKVFGSSRDNFKKLMNKVDKTFIAFSNTDFQNYEEFLLKNIKYEGTISFYIRTFVRLWNIAVEKGYARRNIILLNILNLRLIGVLKQKSGLFQLSQ